MSTTHKGVELPAVGGQGKHLVADHVDPEIAAAAYNAKSAVVVHDGEAFLAPVDSIDPDQVELAGTDEGFALIQDDGNPHNDIVLPGM